MTKEEYLKLVHGSGAFNVMDPDLQQKILVAKGAEKEKYTTIFTEERDFILAAKKELIEKNEAVLKNMGADMKKLSKDYLKKAESSAQQQDEKGADDLLKSI